LTDAALSAPRCTEALPPALRSVLVPTTVTADELAELCTKAHDFGRGAAVCGTCLNFRKGHEVLVLESHEWTAGVSPTS
jgi:hypothetical protein